MKLIRALAILLLLTLPAHAFFFRGGGGTGGGGGGTQVASVTVLNSGGSTIPGSVTPVQFGMWFAPGAVPAGQYCIPSVGGVNLTQWQLDSIARPWNDGSARGGSFSAFLPTALTSGGTAQIICKTATGSWPTSSPGSVANITSGSDFKEVLGGVNGTYVMLNQGMPLMTAIGLNVSGGIVNSGLVRIPPALSATCINGYTCTGTFTVGGCSGTAPTFTLNQVANLPASVNITNAGSGCSTIGSGAFTFDVNSILNGITSIPLCASQTNAQACIYAQGSAKIGVKVWGFYIDTGNANWTTSTGYTSASVINNFGNTYQASGTCTSASSGNGPVGTGLGSTISDGTCTWTWQTGKIAATAWIEAWLNSGGTTFAFRGGVQTDDAVYQTGLSRINNLSYNTADWMNGATEIRGSADGSALAYAYDGITTPPLGGAWFTFDKNSRMDWYQTSGGTTNSAAFNAVIPSLTTADKVYWKASEVMPPLVDAIVPSTLTLPIGPVGGTESANVNICYYRPLAFCDVDTQSGLHAGADHVWEGILTQQNATHYLAQNHASDGGASLLQENIAAALGWMHLYAGLREAATWHAVNIIPNGSTGWTPPAAFIDPARPIAEMVDQNPFDNMGWGLMEQPWVNTDLEHFPNEITYPYIVTGERYLLDALDGIAQANELRWVPEYHRSVQLGATNYPVAIESAGVRDVAWAFDAVEPAVTFLPPAEPDATFQFFILKNYFDEMAASYAYTGTVTWGNPTDVTFTKSSDMTALGPIFSVGNLYNYGGTVDQATSLFMLEYWAAVDLQAEMHLTGIIPSIDTVANTTNNNFQVPYGANACPYLTGEYTQMWIVPETGGTPLTTWDASTFSQSAMPMQFARDSGLFQVYSGDSEVDISGTGIDANTANATSNASGTAFTISTPGNSEDFASTVTRGSIVYDTTTPSAVSKHTWVTAYSFPNVTTNNSTTITSGDVLRFSYRLDYPDTAQLSSGPGTPLPGSGQTYFWLLDTSQLQQCWPSLACSYTTGTFPPASTPTVTETQTPMVWVPDPTNTNGTTGSFKTIGGTTIVWNATATVQAGFNTSATCPAPAAGTINSPSESFNPQDRISQILGNIKWWVALGHSSSQATSAITTLTTMETPLTTTYAPNPKFALDSAF